MTSLAIWASAVSAPTLRGAHDQAAAGVDGGAGDVVAGLLLDRHGLAGQQRLVDRAGALLDDAVGGDLLAGTDDEAVAHCELLDRDAPLGAVGVEDGDVLGAELEQRLQRGAGAPLGARLEVAAGEDEGRDTAARPRGRSRRAPAPRSGSGRTASSCRACRRRRGRARTATTRTRRARRPRSACPSSRCRA